MPAKRPAPAFAPVREEPTEDEIWIEDHEKTWRFGKAVRVQTKVGMGTELQFLKLGKRIAASLKGNQRYQELLDGLDINNTAELVAAGFEIFDMAVETCEVALYDFLSLALGGVGVSDVQQYMSVADIVRWGEKTTERDTRGVLQVLYELQGGETIQRFFSPLFGRLWTIWKQSREQGRREKERQDLMLMQIGQSPEMAEMEPLETAEESASSESTSENSSTPESATTSAA